MTEEHCPCLRDAVRASTRVVHEELERRLDLESGAWTRDRYTAFLRATLAVVEPVEDRIAPLIRPYVPASLESDGAARLRHDLAALGSTSTGLPIPRLPRIEDAAAAFGAAYVLEGSRLGGRIIADILESRLDIGTRHLTYLRPPASQTATRWRTFLASLDSFGRAGDQSQWGATTSTAAGVFAAFEESFVRERVA